MRPPAMALAALAALGALGALAACGDSDGGGLGPDVGPPGDDGSAGEGEGEPDAAPVAELPRMQDWPCPHGWEPFDAEVGRPTEFQYCVPPARVPCERGWWQPIDRAECEPLDSRCGEGPGDVWDNHRDAPGYGGTLHEVADDGELRAALQAALPGDQVRLAAGEYTGGFELVGVALYGACAADVRIVGDFEGPAVTLGPASRLFGVSVEGGHPGVLAEGPGASIERVEVSGCDETGIYFREATGSVRFSVVREVTRSRSGVITGVEHASPGDLLLEHVVVDRVPGRAFRLNPIHGGEVTVKDCVAVDIESGDAQGGVGIEVDGPGRHDLARVLVDGASSMGLRLDSGEAQVRDAVVRHLVGPRSPLGVLINGAAPTVHRLAIYNVGGMAMDIAEPLVGADPPPVRIDDLFIQGAGSRQRPPGRGIQLAEGVHAELRRAHIEGVADVGLFVGRSTRGRPGRAEVLATDLIVRGTASNWELQGGQGLGVDAGNHLTVRRALIEGNRAAGVFASGWFRAPETELELSDLTIRDTSPRSAPSTRSQRPRAAITGTDVSTAADRPCWPWAAHGSGWTASSSNARAWRGCTMTPTR